MNKKIFIPSIGLMALLAACSNDEMFENKPISVNNDGRPQVNLVVGAELPEMEAASTRMTGEVYDDENGKKQYSWLWTENDVLGGTLFEDTEGYIHNGMYQTNYAFIRSDRGSGAGDLAEANFKTLSPVTVGSYMFYHPYNADSKQHQLGHELGDENNRISGMVTGDNEGIASLGSSKDKNFFFTALNKVAIDFDEEKFEAEARTLPLAFTSAYSFMRIDLTGDFKATSTTDYYKNFTINKVELSTVGEKGKATPFVTEFTINPQTIAAIQYDLAKESLIGSVDAKNGALLQDNPNLATDIRTVRSVLRQDKYKFQNSFELNGVSYSEGAELNILNPVDSKTATKLIYELATPFKIESINDHFVLWIPVPAGTYAYDSEQYTFNGAEKTGNGALKIEVYTSEGKATFFIGEENITLNRDQSNRVAKTLFIKDDETNIDLYAFNENGIDVATNEEWNYAIDYIENHNYVFSNKTPIINLKGDIEIGKDDIKNLPTWKLQIVGDKKITLNGNVTLDPDKTILGEGGKNVPTLIVAEGSTLNFAKDIATLKLINNGTVTANHNVAMQAMTSGTDATLTIEAGKQVSVTAEGEANAYDVNLGAKATFTVSATNAAVKGTMTAENGAVVTLNGTTANATNNVTLKPASTLNVKGGAYTTSGALDIQADGENVSTVNITSSTVNTGDITVSGKLTAKALNNKGDFTVKAAQDKGRDLSGAVVLTSLTNDGTVTTEMGATEKNTYGGTIDVNVLTNNNVINNNGELVVSQRGSNKAVTGTINLQSDKYALIVLPGSQFANNGKIVIDEPKNYNIYEYYKNWNHLENLSGNGTIEATLTSQDQYDQVLKQQKDYSATNKYTAWDVINKFYVDCNLKLTKVSSDRDSKLKDVVLKANRELTVVDGLVVNSFTTEGANSVLKTDATKTVTFTVQTANVAKNSSVTIAEKVKLLIKYQALVGTNYMLNVAGELTNKGQIDTEDGTTTKGHQISAYIASTGKLINEGSLSKKSEAKYDLAAYRVLADMISELYTPGQTFGSDYRGVHKNDNSMRVDLMNYTVANLPDGEWNDQSTWDNNTSNSADNAVTAERLKYILANGVLTTVQNYQVIAAAHPNAEGWSYAIYLGGSNTGNTEVISSKVFAEIKQIVEDGEFQIADGKPSDMPYLYKTWFVVEELCGTLNLSKGEAWGEVKKVNGGTLINDFTNRL